MSLSRAGVNCDEPSEDTCAYCFGVWDGAQCGESRQRFSQTDQDLHRSTDRSEFLGERAQTQEKTLCVQVEQISRASQVLNIAAVFAWVQPLLLKFPDRSCDPNVINTAGPVAALWCTVCGMHWDDGGAVCLGNGWLHNIFVCALVLNCSKLAFVISSWCDCLRRAVWPILCLKDFLLSQCFVFVFFIHCSTLEFFPAVKLAAFG